MHQQQPEIVIHLCTVCYKQSIGVFGVDHDNTFNMTATSFSTKSQFLQRQVLALTLTATLFKGDDRSFLKWLP